MGKERNTLVSSHGEQGTIEARKHWQQQKAAVGNQAEADLDKVCEGKNDGFASACRVDLK